VILGGGPGGATAALLLARGGWSVAVVERKAFPRRKVCGEYLSATNLPLLRALGVSDAFHAQAGPDVREVGLFGGTSILRAPLPRPRGDWGRALGREHLDALLLTAAARAGAEVIQPWSVTGLRSEGEMHVCCAESVPTGATLELRAPVMIAAHGSWEPGALPTQIARQPPRPGDLLGFKAHFHNSDLPAGLMPLLVFPGGYGGMVHTEAGRVSLSCCVRRDRLAAIRGRSSGAAGDAILQFLDSECLGVRRALAGARREGDWLAAGPIRPGVRLRYGRGIFPVGNCAGEAHPAVAEGISMAMQSSWLLTRRLIAWRRAGGVRAYLDVVGDAYAAAWRRNFAGRLYASEALAQWAMRPAAVAGTLPLLHLFPGILPWAARLSGKAKRVVTRQ
jgi:flavin-dependent dehydrogenase